MLFGLKTAIQNICQLQTLILWIKNINYVRYILKTECSISKRIDSCPLLHQHYLKVSSTNSFYGLTKLLIMYPVFLDRVPVVISVPSQNVNETIIIDDDVPPGIPINALTSRTKYGVCYINYILLFSN